MNAGMSTFNQDIYDQVNTLLQHIQNLQLEKIALKQKIKYEKLQRKKQTLCQTLQSVRLKDEVLEDANILKLWFKVIENIKYDSRLQKEDTELYSTSYCVENDTPACKTVKEVLKFSFSYKGYLLEIDITKHIPLTFCSDKDSGKQDVKDKHLECNNTVVKSSMFVEGLQESVKHHVIEQTQFDNMFSDLKQCMEKGLLPFNII